MIIVTAKAKLRAYSAAYVAFRDYVVSQNGSIASASSTQAALDLLATLPQVVQWLDARAGVNAASGRWYSLVDRATDVVRTSYGFPTHGTDAVLNQAVWAGGAWQNSVTPTLGLDDDYTWGMRVYLEENAAGYLWGDRHDSSANQNGSAWNWLSTEDWRNYNSGNDTGIPITLPRKRWFWVWVVKRGAQVTGYLNDALLFSTTLSVPMAALSCGIAGGTDSIGVLSSAARYQAFIRVAGALTEAQRDAVMNI